MQEMVRLYNRANLSEKCSLTLSVSLGKMESFHVPPSSKSSYAFSALQVTSRVRISIHARENTF
jgi:hypothetical protein